MSPYAIETIALTKKYDDQVSVDNLSMNVKQGKIYGLLGRNGAGKTTTIRMIMGLAQMTSGEIKIFGEDVRDHAQKIYNRIGSMIETPGFYENLTGRENLTIYAKLRGLHRKDEIEHALAIVGLDQEPRKLVGNYSLGMKQRLGIAAAIMHKPELLILDEPTNGLDPIGIHEMRNFLVNLCKEQQITIMISSHILSEIEQMADTIGVMHEGKLIEETDMDELRRKNRMYTEFQVSDENKAVLLLEKQLEIYSYSVHEHGHIRVYSHFGKQDIINKLFVTHDISVSKIAVNEEKLEDYFSKLIGGGSIG
ncbi:ABC transporter ATP-binding protein [Paenibacillus sp. KN14-4R]|uniref:ABC transporter ATP-binding protein n=1 Tax=Paenibacillus sp. KN14-4R TaxID=3445773 RepID=UPI003FA0FAB5